MKNLTAILDLMTMGLDDRAAVLSLFNAANGQPLDDNSGLACDLLEDVMNTLSTIDLAQLMNEIDILGERLHYYSLNRRLT